MNAAKAGSPGLTLYSRLVLLVLVLPLLFIAGVQLFILSDQTETLFAWTFALPLSAAFMGAGYWAAMFHAYSAAQSKGWSYVRSSFPAALIATTMLSVTTFLHLDKFHQNSPLAITQFVTWVWIAVYVVVPPILAIAWIIQSRLPDAKLRGHDPLSGWLRAGFALLALFFLVAGLALFLAPEAMSSVWPWAITPLAARAISSWLTAFGVACATLVFENDIAFGAGTCTSLLAFCILELIVVARFSAAINWGRPLAIAYILFLVLGVLIPGGNLLARRRLRN